MYSFGWTHNDESVSRFQVYAWVRQTGDSESNSNAVPCRLYWNHVIQTERYANVYEIEAGQRKIVILINDSCISTIEMKLCSIWDKSSDKNRRK